MGIKYTCDMEYDLFILFSAPVVSCTYSVVALILQCVDFVIPAFVGAYVVKIVRNFSQRVWYLKSPEGVCGYTSQDLKTVWKRLG
jgi:hypothetical protein